MPCDGAPAPASFGCAVDSPVALGLVRVAAVELLFEACFDSEYGALLPPPAGLRPETANGKNQEPKAGVRP